MPVIRTRKMGDYLRIHADGGKKSLKRYLIDEKIPREEREDLPLLADGDHILWVIGSARGIKLQNIQKRFCKYK